MRCLLVRHCVCRGENPRLRPPRSYSITKRRGFNADQLRGVSRAQALPKIGHKNSASSISRLFRCRGPSAVFRAVWAIVVYAVKSMFSRWAVPHIVEKIGKVVPPSTNHYSAPSVSGVLLTCWAVASASHIHPDSKLCADMPVRRISVFRFRSNHRREPQATATLFSAIPKFFAAGYGRVSTLAHAIPMNKSIAVIRLGDNQQFPEFLSN